MMRKLLILCASVMMLSACNNDIEPEKLSVAPATPDAYAALSAELEAYTQEFLAGTETLPQTRGASDDLWEVVEADAEGAIYGFFKGKTLKSRLIKAVYYGAVASAFALFNQEYAVSDDVRDLYSDLHNLSFSNPQPFELSIAEDLGPAHNEVLNYTLKQISLAPFKSFEDLRAGTSAIIENAMAYYGYPYERPSVLDPSEVVTPEDHEKIDGAISYVRSFTTGLKLLANERSRMDYYNGYTKSIRESEIEEEDQDLLVGYVSTYYNSHELWQPLYALHAAAQNEIWATQDIMIRQSIETDRSIMPVR